MFNLVKQNKLIKIATFLTLLGVFCSVSFGFSYAAEDTHTVKQQVTDDTTDPPGTPQNLTATAVSTSQIDLSWDTASAGDLAVDGYEIFRDDVFLATSTTATTYSDTSLTAETTYTYKVRAFDTADNYSGFSNEAFATTLSETSENQVTTAGGGLIFNIKSVSVEPDFYKATIKVETNFASRILFKWGETPDHEAEIITSGDLTKLHVINLNNLKPDTRYYFEFEVTDKIGRNIHVRNQSFETLSLPSTDLPLNVSDFRAIADKEKINLSWINPSIDFKEVRIVRSESFFPRDPFDGKLIYAGRGEKYIDKDVEENVDYYYATFVLDNNGRFSSGSLAKARLGAEPIVDLFGGLIQLPQSEVHPMIRALTLRDFKFVQEGKEIPVSLDNLVRIKGDRILKVAIDYQKLPTILKTLAVTLKDPNDPNKIFNFLLRANQDKTAYEASIAPLGRIGFFGLSISILDHKNRSLKNLTGSLKSLLPFGLPFDYRIINFTAVVFFILFVLILILAMKILWAFLNSLKRKHEATT